MELRVWVDGTQRVVCGVKLTTTCQEIVVALAQATQQAGRFTMIERWRNNERLLAPNEQPLVTLQRWGDRMAEVEFILRKTSTDSQPPPASNLPMNQHQQQQQLPMRQGQIRPTNDNDQASSINGIRGSPVNPINQSTNHQILNDPTFDGMYPSRSHQYNLTRRPQTVLGPLTSSNSSLGLDSNYLQTRQQNLSRLPNSFRTSVSATTLPSANNSMTASPSNMNPTMRGRYTDDQIINTSSSSMMAANALNGYPMHSENQHQQDITEQSRPNVVSQANKNYPFEDLYSTINKKRTNQPPAIPAKPRIVNPMVAMNNFQLLQQHPNPQQASHLQSLNNAQMNFYNSNNSPLSMYSSNIRPRHPPGYLDYLEAMANRNSLPQPIMSSQNYNSTNQHAQGNTFQRQFDSHQACLRQQNGSSPISTSSKYRYSTNGPLSRSYDHQNQDYAPNTSRQIMNQVHPKLMESNLVINRGSAINVRLPPSSQNVIAHGSNVGDLTENSSTSNPDISSSVSQMGHDMLKVIEEQKKVLLNQKNELDRLDNDQEYWEAKQNSEQAELVNRIETEIRQLEELWKENQAQIKKLENQDFEKEIQDLKKEQVKMEQEIAKQKEKLTRCEEDIMTYKTKIEQLENELAHLESHPDADSSASSSSCDETESIEQDDAHSNNNTNVLENETPLNESQKSSESSDERPLRLDLHTNGTNNNGEVYKGSKSSEDEEDEEEDSGGDASDDLNLAIPDNKLRLAKDVPYVDKRGLINGFRSLKLEKTRAFGKQIDTLRSAESAPTVQAPCNSPINNQDSNNTSFPH